MKIQFAHEFLELLIWKLFVRKLIEIIPLNVEDLYASCPVSRFGLHTLNAFMFPLTHVIMVLYYAPSGLKASTGYTDGLHPSLIYCTPPGLIRDSVYRKQKIQFFTIFDGTQTGSKTGMTQIVKMIADWNDLRSCVTLIIADHRMNYSL